ncbi:MAG TPA: hypothetical protein VF899_00865 [Pyrinomonadaceae bacterium]
MTLTNGVALVKFSQPKNATNHGSLGPMIFAGKKQRAGFRL